MRKLLSNLVLFAVLIAATSVVWAQGQSGMTGIVTDTSGAVLPNTTVTLTDPQKGTTFNQTTDSQGSYRFVNVPPAPTYQVTFSHEGFATEQVSNMALVVGITRTQNAKLAAGANAQVEVSADAATVTLNTTDASVGNNFDVKLINELPVQNRDTPQALFALQPGNANGAITGARQDQNIVTVDGMDANDVSAGQSSSTVSSAFPITAGAPVDAIQEFRGTTAGLPSNIGTGSGGQFQLVTKSGTNSWHGLLYEYHRDTATVANLWFNNNAGTPRTPLIRNQFGGNIGGPALHDKLFFFFDFNNSRIIQSQTGTRTVPLDSYRNGNVSYIRNVSSTTGATCLATSRQNTTPDCIGTLSSAQVAALDPQKKGFSAPLLSLINSRYPHANDLTLGDGINSGGYRFTIPTPNFLYNYVARVDYNLTSSQRLFASYRLQRQDNTYSVRQFPTDPETFPFQDRSYGYTISHIWQINQKVVNQFYYGDTVQVYAFPTLFNPTGTSQFTFGGATQGVEFTNAYANASSQRRRVPIPELRDDMNITLGSHNLAFGGTFKFIKTNSNLVGDFNGVTLGLGGKNLTLDSTLRPTDIRTAGTTAANTFDNAFALALGRIGAISSNYNYTNTGAVIPQGTGATRRYRNYQTELYIGDTWKATPHLTLTYGLRWQYYTVPYEVNGAESIQNRDFDSYFAARIAQSNAGTSGATSLPLITYNLGGKANNAAPLYNDNLKDFAPRLAFAYNPEALPKTVINGSFAMVYDRTVINAVNFIQDQSSYLFQNSANAQYGAGTAGAALLSDPRLGGTGAVTGSGTGQTVNLTIPAPPAAPTITRPYTPYIDDAVGTNSGFANAPYGLGANIFNTIIDPRLKDPYSLTFNAGIQQQLPGNFILRANYVGRLGRRLLAQADASQIVDFRDPASGQTMNQAFTNLVLQGRAGRPYTAQPFYENQLGRGLTVAAANAASSLVSVGDFADFTQFLATNGLLRPNVGMASQFAGNTFETNKGYSSYNGLLVTLTKNYSHGLQFDFNYTYSHSIDNVSAVANYIASSQGKNFICDATSSVSCIAASDFDLRHVISSDFVYALPFGRGRTFASKAPRWLDEVIGGWAVTGNPSYRTGYPFNAITNAFVAGYANNAPAIFNGNTADVKPTRHKNSNGRVFIYSGDGTQAASNFQGPIGLTIGARNNLRGLNAFTMDAGLRKRFAIIGDRLGLKFGADFFNVMNHPVFGLPNNDITSGSFGQITTTPSSTQSGGPRVGQFSLRLEF